MGADLSSLTTMASTVAVRRIDRKLLRNRVDDVESENAEQRKPSLSPEELESLCVIMDDFLEAVSKVQPSALREGFTTVPDVTWDDVGALDEVKKMKITQSRPNRNTHPLFREQKFPNILLT